VSEKTVVLMASYNGMKYIDEQIQLILSQTTVSLHIFISVDLSSDDTYEYCKAMEEKDTRITVLEYGERFGGAAKNFFRLIRDVDLSPFDYVALADQDDIWLPDKLFRAVRAIEDKGVDAYSSDVTAFWSTGRRELIKKSYPQRKYDFLFESAGPGCTYVFKRASLAKFKLFLFQNEQAVNNVSLHDWMLYAFFRSNAMPWYIDDYASMLYRQHSSNQIGSNSGLRAFQQRISMIRSHWYRGEVEKIIQLLSKTGCNFSLNRFSLLMHSHELRRRARDRWVLFIFILLGLF